MATSPADPASAYAAAGQTFYASRDGGATWRAIGTLPSGVTALQPANWDAALVYVGTQSSGVFRSYNGGQSWQGVSDGLGLLPGTILEVRALALDDKDDRIVYAATGFWLGTTTMHYSPVALTFSTDGGTAWLPLAELPLGSQPVEQLVPLDGQPLALRAIAADGATRQYVAETTPLVAMLGATEETAGRRAAAARALGMLGDPSAVPALVSALETDEPVLATAVAEALGRLQAVEAVPTLARVLHSPDAAAPSAAANALAAIGTPEALDALMAALGSDEMTAARHAAMSALETLGSPAVPGLLNLAATGDVAAQRNAVELLGWIGDPAALDGLLAALQAVDDGVRAQAAWALGELGDPAALEALASAASGDASAQVRLQATQAMARLPQVEGALAQAPAQIAPAPETAAQPGTVVTDEGRSPAAPNELLPILRWLLLALVLILAALLPWYQNLREERRNRHN